MDLDADKKFRFKRFPAYQAGRDFNRKIKSISSKRFPVQEQFQLKPQLWRALDSIVLNIAEGSSRGTDKDFSRFLNISNGSIDEVVGCLDIALDSGYIETSTHNALISEAAGLANQITAFQKALAKTYA